MALVGFYLLTNQVTVRTGFWELWGRNAMGVTLIPFGIGAGALFVDAKSVLGWVLAAGSVLVILAGVIFNLRFYFAPTSLWNTLLILVLLGGGLGLVVRSLRAH